MQDQTPARTAGPTDIKDDMVRREAKKATVWIGIASLFALAVMLAQPIMVIIGGMGSIMGSFFGAAFIVILPIVINQGLPWLGHLFGFVVSTAALTHAEQIIFGSLIVWFLIVEPHGLARLWSVGKQKLRLWPFPH